MLSNLMVTVLCVCSTICASAAWCCKRQEVETTADWMEGWARYWCLGFTAAATLVASAGNTHTVLVQHLQRLHPTLDWRLRRECDRHCHLKSDHCVSLFLLQTLQILNARPSQKTVKAPPTQSQLDSTYLGSVSLSVHRVHAQIHGLHLTSWEKTGSDTSPLLTFFQEKCVSPYSGGKSLQTVWTQRQWLSFCICLAASYTLRWKKTLLFNC